MVRTASVGDQKERNANLSPSTHVVHVTAQHVISRRWLDENDYKVYAQQKARAKCAKLLFSIGRFYARGRIIRLDELSSDMRRSSRTTEESWSRWIMHLVPVFTLETNNQTKNECLPKFVQTDNASSSIKTAIVKHANVWRSRCCRRYDFLNSSIEVSTGTCQPSFSETKSTYLRTSVHDSREVEIYHRF